MRVRTAADPREFLAATHELRGADPVRTNMLGSIAESVDAGRRYESEHWFLVEEGDTVVAAAVWTPPHNLVLGPMTREQARAVALTAAGLGPRVPGITGAEPAASAAVAALGAEVDVVTRERILVLGRHVPPPPVPGGPRLAEERDLDLLTQWLVDFARDAGLAVMDAGPSARASLGRMWIWEVDSVPVSIAGHTPVVTTPAGTVARIGPVFTPAAHRRRGFGAAVTSAVTVRLLADVDTVMLFTDASNPTSNAIYERLGFAHQADMVMLDFVRASS